MSSFVHLHVHTNYSILNGLGKPKEFVKKAKELGFEGLAITDSGNLYGYFEFYKACKDNGINPILGIEASISKKGIGNKDKDNEYYEVILLAKNIDGFKNLIELTTISYLDGFYYKPRIDFELLEKYSKDIICLSGSFLGEIAQHIITGKNEDFIVDRIDYYKGVFGKDDFYLEIQEHPDRQSQGKVNDYIVNLAKKHGFKVVATNDVHYLTESDAEAQDLLFSIGDGRPFDDPDRPTLIEGNYSLRSTQEMEELFSYFPQAISTTSEINEKVNIIIPYGGTLIPVSELNQEQKEIFEKYKIFVKDDKSIKDLGEEEWGLRYLCMRGLNHRYEYGFDEDTIFELIKKKDIEKPDKKLSDMSAIELHELSRQYFTDRKNDFVKALREDQQSIIDRLEYELVVVDLMGFNGYFIIVADFINWAKSQDIPVGPGRGSAAGALLAYLSGITDIDPLKYSLLFERFLNPARVSMPDIDVDFSDEGRGKVLEYVRNKYGKDHVAQICTFGTMAARAAVKDIGRALGLPFSEMNDIAKLIPAKPGIKIKDALEESVEFKNLYNSGDKYKKIIDNAMRLEGSVRQLGVHACAVIIAPEKMTNFCSLQHPPKDDQVTVTQLSQYPLEDLGLLKMDFLGLRNLTIIHRCLTIIKKNHDREIDLLKIDYEDKKVFKIFADGDTTGVFQFESAGMRKYLKELKPNAFEDIIVMVSLYRPGPLLYIPTYIARKHGKEKVKYPHPSLENILKHTQGIAVYQEQIMQLVQAFAGFSLGEADILRRAIGKKKVDLLMEQKQKFIDAAIVQGHPKELAIYIFEDIIEPFAGYGFNKSHAACYSMIAYQTAYLKAYYPTEFMTALMVSDEEDMERITLEINECKSKKINVLAPDINESMKHFTYIDKDNIRFGLKAIKGLGGGPIDTIRKSRDSEGKFESVLDLINKTGGDVINKKSLEALILSGALDNFGERASLMASIQKITAYLKENQKKQETNQIGLFDLGISDEKLKFHLEKAIPMNFEEKIRGERDMIGYSVTGHGLDGLKKYLTQKSIGLENVYEFKKKMQEKTVELKEFISDKIIETGETDGSEQIIEPQKTEDDVKQVEEEEIIKVEEKKVRKKDVKVRFFGLVTFIRKVQTKSGKMMLIANCDSTTFKFNVLVFPRDYEKFVNTIQEYKVLLVDGNLSLNEDREEIAVMPASIRSTTIGFLREQAIDIGVFDENDKINYLMEDEDSLLSQEKTKNEKTEKNIAFVKEIKKDDRYMIDIPNHAVREDLVKLKEYMVTLKGGDIRIFLNIKGQEIDSKLSLDETSELEEWIKTNF
ncbi:MAG: DNA polymerase III subunit alpha [Candidatus Gracilibacteria bacterium]|nr:DNA polymerase III subunit alpha [Candidatus Gracilibacteria bacterium]